MSMNPPPGGWQPGFQHHSGPEAPGPQGAPPFPNQTGPDQPGPHQGPPRTEQMGGPKKKAPKGLIIGLIAAAVVLVLAVGGYFIHNAVQTKRAEERRAEALATETDAASAAVQAYLQALADGDAQAALDQAAEAPESPLLTDEVLDSSNEQGGIEAPATTDATMKQLEDDSVPSGVVSATFMVQGVEAAADFAVTNTPEGWRLESVTNPVDLGDIAVKVNGVKATGVVEAFPGTYTMTSANDRLKVDRSDLSVLEVGKELPADWTTQPELSDKGRKDVIAAGKRAIDGCLAKKELMPQGCPMIRWEEKDGIRLDKETLKYTLTNDPWRDFDPRLAANGTEATGTLTTKVRLQANATQNGAEGTVEDKQEQSFTLVADVSEPRVKVTFTF